MTGRVGDDVRCELHPLHVTMDLSGHDEHEVGRLDTGTFVAMPGSGIDLVGWLGMGLTTGEVRRRFLESYGQQPDLEDFLATLSDCGFLRQLDGRPVDALDQAGGEEGGWRPFLSLSAPRLAWMRSRPARFLGTLVAAVAWLGVPLFFVLRPGAWPTAADAWIGGSVSLSLNFAVLGVLGWALVLLHELSHLFAMRALDQDCSLTLSHRLYFVVAQTNMSNARALPRRTRLVPYLSGMTWDLTVLLTCLVVHATVLPVPILGAVIYMTTMGLLFQCAIFMRTDVYYVVTNWLRLSNLMENTRQWLADTGRRAVGLAPRHDLSEVPAHELRIVRAYAVLCVAGLVVLSALAFLLYLPLLGKFVLATVQGLTGRSGQAAFWDAAAFLAVTLAYFFTLVAVSVKEWRQRQRRRPDTAQSRPTALTLR